MKKFLVTTVTSFALIATPAIVGGSTAAAAPYEGTVTTTPTAAPVQQVVPRNRLIRARYRLATAGNGQPTGRVYIRVKNLRTGKTFVTSRFYIGGTRTWKFKRAQARGNYRITFTYAPPDGSVYKLSRTRVVIRKR